MEQTNIERKGIEDLKDRETIYHYLSKKEKLSIKDNRSVA